MKLFYCANCNDVVRLRPSIRTCLCGQSGGKYLPGGLNAELYGDAIAIGFANGSFLDALGRRPHGGLGVRFDAFVIPVVCPTIKSLPEVSPINLIRPNVGKKGKKKEEDETNQEQEVPAG